LCGFGCVTNYAGGLPSHVSVQVSNYQPLYCNLVEIYDPPLEDAIEALIGVFGEKSILDFQSNVLSSLSVSLISEYLPVVIAPLLPTFTSDPGSLHLSIVLALAGGQPGGSAAQLCTDLNKYVLSPLLSIEPGNLTDCYLELLDGEYNIYLWSTDTTAAPPVVPAPAPGVSLAPSPSTKVPSPNKSPSSSPTSTHPSPSPAPHASTPTVKAPSAPTAPVEAPSPPLGEGSQLSIWPTLFLSISLAVLRYIV